MDCDYCGYATGKPALWEVSSGGPGDGMTRYPCDAHLPSALRHVAVTGEVRLFEQARPRRLYVCQSPALDRQIGAAA